MSPRIRLLIAIAMAPMPQLVKRLVLRRILGADMHRTARIGFSIVDSERLEMGAGSRIGHLTVVRGLRRTLLGPGATVGNLDWITASPMFRTESAEDFNDGCFALGRESALTSRHYVDCSGGVTIGEYTTVAGVRSTILSHQIDLAEGIQTARSTQVGNYCFVSSNVCLTPGSSVPDRSIVAMGAVVVGELKPAGALFGGVPARVVRPSADAGKYFRRTSGFVGLQPSDAPGGDPAGRKA